MKCLRACEDSHVYVILPYFNFCSSVRRRTLFVDFVKRYTSTKDVRLVVVECTNGTMPLPFMPHTFMHIKIESRDTLWIKESLINIGIERLPSCWRYVAWIDADVMFVNERWVQMTKEALETYDVVQCFHTAIHLGPSGDPIKQDKSFGYMHASSGTPYTKNDKYGFWHPGFAWACHRDAYTRMGRLLDWAILGSGDRHMALALIGRVLDSAPGNVHTNYKTLLLSFQRSVQGLRLGWVPGTIVHHWHGSLKDRKYKERWDTLTSEQYDPLSDVGLTQHGLTQFTASGKRFNPLIEQYFRDRHEDS